MPGTPRIPVNVYADWYYSRAVNERVEAKGPVFAACTGASKHGPGDPPALTADSVGLKISGKEELMPPKPFFPPALKRP